MSTQHRIGSLRSGTSLSATPSDKYIGWWPATKYINPAGTQVPPSITLAVAGISANTIGNTSTPAAGSQSWIAAGKRVRVRNTGTMPTGLVATTIYFLGRPTATTVSFHTTLADALANTNLVAFSGGTANIVIYEAVVEDYSGQGREMTIPPNNNDQVWLATAPYVSASSSGSLDTCAALLDITSAAAALAFPQNSFLMTARITCASPIASRSMFGCGASGVDGPRMNVDSTDTSKILLQWYHSGGTAINLGFTAAPALTAAERHIALAVDGPNRMAHMWIDGERDLTVFNRSIAASGPVTWPATLRWGGATNNNAQAGGWADMNLLAFPGALPANISSIVALLASTRYYRLTTLDV